MHFLESEDTTPLRFAADDLIESTATLSERVRDETNLIIKAGGYDYYEDGNFTEITSSVINAQDQTITILPEDSLPTLDPSSKTFDTEFQVRRRTALECAKYLIDSGCTPLVLNFADGLKPGVIPKFKQRTQEELNCRASALLECLQGSKMYSENKKLGAGGDYSSTCVISPGVPVFKKENGILIQNPYKVDFVSCAAPMRDAKNQQRTLAILRERIARVLEVAKAYNYENLVLGAWGCGGCGNDASAVAFSFFQLLSNEFEGAFNKVCFAIADQTENPNDLRRGIYIEPFKDFFCDIRKHQIKRLSNARSLKKWLSDWIQIAEKAIHDKADQELTDKVVKVLSNNQQVLDNFPLIAARLRRPSDLLTLKSLAVTEIRDAETTLLQIKQRNPYAFQQLISTQPLHSLKAKEIFTQSGFRICETHQIASRSATFGMVPAHLHEQIRSKLLEKFPDGLYEHQAGAMNAFLNGDDLCLATSTASGKSLIFMALTADHLKKNPNSRVIAVYPQRALTQDQLGKWKSFLDGTGITVGLIDGSVRDMNERLQILENSKVVVMTPDVIHSWLMRTLIDTRENLQQLGLLILDECHLYTEILGTNMAYLLRRIHCVTGGGYRMIAATATVGDPAGMISKLTGRSSFKIIGADDEKSPCPEKNLLLVQYDRSNLTREQRDSNLVAELADHYNGKFLVFVDSRQRVERIAAQAASTQVTGHGVLPYRSGYEAKDRREIQIALGAGNLKGVITTSALEVGVDIGDIDLVVILGYPPSVKSFWQRFGRAGRRADRRCDCVVIDTMGIMASIDKGLVEYMKKPAEESLFYIENRFLRYGNVLCAAYELSQIKGNQTLPDEEALGSRYIDLPGSFAAAVLNELSPKTAIPSELLAMKPTENQTPHFKLSLRQVMEEQFLIRKDEGSEIEQLSASQRFKEAYPGAVFRHRKIAYRITTRRLGRDMLELVATQPHGIDSRLTHRVAKEWITPDFNFTRFLKKSRTGYAVACNIQIVERVFGFKERQNDGAGSEQEIEYDQSYPYQHAPLARIIQTTGVVISLPDNVVDSRVTKFLMEGFSTISGISMRNIGFGSVSRPQCPFFKEAHDAICIYDDVQGGFRLTEDLIGCLEEVAQRAALIAADCNDENRDALVTMLQNLERHFLSLRNVQVGTGYRGEALEISRQEGAFRLVVRPGQNVVLYSDPDKREFEITSVFLTPAGEVKYRTSAKTTIEHENLLIVPGETRLGWFDPNEGDVLPEGEGPEALSIQSVQVMPPTYQFRLRSLQTETGDYDQMVPMDNFSNGDLVLIRDPRMPSGIGLGRWFESKISDVQPPLLKCRLRSLQADAPDDVWSGEFHDGERPEFGWWAVQRR
jgi:DEAD/DEAH box helicase domain-containing protein